MKRSTISIWPGTASLLLVLAVLSLSLLAALTALSAHNDTQLTLRSINIAETDLSLYAEAEKARAALSGAANTDNPKGETAEAMLARISDALPAGAAVEDSSVSFVEKDGARDLSVTLKASNVDGRWQFDYTERRLLPETEDSEWN